MRLTVLGRWSPYPPADGACPGYLLEAAGHRLLLDCGTGALANLQRVATVFDLQGIVITHLHPDHVLDLFALKQALTFGHYPQVPPPVPLLAPPYAEEALPACMARLLPQDQEEEVSRFRERFLFMPILEDREVTVGPFVLRFAQTAHSILCFGIRVEAGGRTLAYSADTGPSESIEALAREAHLFLCESTLPAQHEEQAPRVGHLSGRLAGQMAARAGVQRLLLTHFFVPYGDDTEEARAGAAKEFGGQVLIAKEMQAYDV